MFGRFGITRLADVTGLDRIGIPVWMAVRPNSKTLAVSQGKGLNTRRRAGLRRHGGGRGRDGGALSHPAAHRLHGASSQRTASARCRSTTCCAEARSRTPTRDHPLGGGLRPSARRRPPGCRPTSSRSTRWASAATPSRYWQSSDGLASGNVLLEAVVHGLLERVERDADASCGSFCSDADVLERCVDPAALEDEAVLTLAASDRAGRLPAPALRHHQRYRRAGLLLHRRAVTERPRGSVEALRPVERHGRPSLAGARRRPRHHRGRAEPRDQHHRRARRLRSEPLRQTQLKADLTAYLKPRRTPARSPTSPTCRTRQDNLRLHPGAARRRRRRPRPSSVPLAGERRARLRGRQGARSANWRIRRATAASATASGRSRF